MIPPIVLSQIFIGIEYSFFLGILIGCDHSLRTVSERAGLRRALKTVMLGRGLDDGEFGVSWDFQALTDLW